ncbi:SIR2 family NAD-dependent protein deacylase [Bacillus paranthracis]|uniref:SIR2 family NAD-dependent protein deacylase n=1 Tax=Bacillus paranthracis TaxID=2026186 RepID=UPI0022E82CFC|nr:SIR2 family protein [Bacillus paranthracis]
MNIFLDDLRKDYHNGMLVPFIGSGLSVPFKVPTWGDMIRGLVEKYAEQEFVKQLVEVDLSRYDYWKAIDNLKEYTVIQEEDIQEEVVKLIQQRQVRLEDNSLHNYSDLSSLDFNFYLTTNYENLLHKYLEFDIQPISLSDIQFNTQEIFNQKRVCQLHGTSSNAGTIVLSRESYEKLYSNKKYDDLLRLVTGTKKLLFMGFSFDDQFIKTLIEQHKESYRGEHYILLNNPSPEKIKELRSQYRLITIPYNTENSSHTIEIRKILQEMSRPLTKENEENPSGGNQVESPVVIGAGLSLFKKNLEDNLFYKKLKLEKINPMLIELSSDFYIAADEYIREMNKLGMPLDVIDIILGQVFLEYQERYIDTFSKDGNSEEFLKVVHRSLENIDYGRYKELLQKNITNKYENRGFVHVLADADDDQKKEIWWGEERLDGATNEA